MATGRAALRQIHLYQRPPRPPNSATRASRTPARYFTRNHRLLLLTSYSAPRPQLPFLHTPTTLSSLPQSSRLISTQTKTYIKEQLWLSGKLLSVTSLGLGLLAWFAFGVYNTVREQQYPTPQDYTIWSTVLSHEVRSRLDQKWKGAADELDYASVGDLSEKLIARLEDPSKDGKGVRQRDDADDQDDDVPLLLSAASARGLDVTAKDDAWRQSYFETLLTLASAAEHLEGWLRDTVNLVSVPPEFVKGPSNPKPRPLPYGAPRSFEEDCEVMFAPPGTYYHKIFTTKGFSNTQRITAALQYQEWLDFRGRTTAADDVLRWAMSLALMPKGQSASSFVDTKTGVLQKGATPTENMVKVCTARAIHTARASGPEAALPIFLSIYRARRNAPTPELSRAAVQLESSSKEATDGLFAQLVAYMKKRPPPPVPSGDRSIAPASADPCEIAGLKTYIGEILFSLGQARRETGIEWSREAADEAQAAWTATTADPRLKKMCETCVDVAMANWQRMVALMAENEARAVWLSRNAGWREWVGFRQFASQRDEDEDGTEEPAGSRSLELAEVERRIHEFGLMKSRAQHGLTVV